MDDGVRGGRLLIGCAAAMAVALLVLSGVSLAGKSGPKLAAGTFNLAGQTTNGTTVKCPKGKRVLSGGSIQAGGPVNLVTQMSAPLDNGRGWSVGMRNSDFPTNSQTITAMAVCSKERTRMDLTRFFVDPGDAEGATLTCNRGERAVGGGVLPVNAGVQNFLVKANGPLNASGDALNTDDGDKPVKWFAEMANGSPSRALVAVWVICAQGKATIESTQFVLDEGEDGEAHVTCGRKRTAIGGGVMPVGETRTMNVEASGPLPAGGFVEDVRNGDKPAEWYGAAENFAGGPDRIFKVMAICR